MTNEEKVRQVYPDAWLNGCESHYAVDNSAFLEDCYKILSEVFSSPEEAWADAAQRIDAAQRKG